MRVLLARAWRKRRGSSSTCNTPSESVCAKFREHSQDGSIAGSARGDLDFPTLSLKDLIEARDLYHFHLMSKANVVGTAVGLCLIRNDEEWPKGPRRRRSTESQAGLREPS
jgi:hypothetical protein